MRTEIHEHQFHADAQIGVQIRRSCRSHLCSYRSIPMFMPILLQNGTDKLAESDAPSRESMSAPVSSPPSINASSCHADSQQNPRCSMNSFTIFLNSSLKRLVWFFMINMNCRATIAKRICGQHGAMTIWKLDETDVARNSRINHATFGTIARCSQICNLER